MATVSLRLPGIVGPDHNRPWVARLAAEMAETGRATVYNPDSLFNSSLHVDDLCRFVARLLDFGWHGHELATLAAAQPIAIREIVERLAALRYPNARLHVADGRQHSYIVAIDKAVRDFGFSPMTMDEQLIRFANEL
jgi:nucleoside-diphosphate-sugar epimerase